MSRMQVITEMDADFNKRHKVSGLLLTRVSEYR